MSVQATLAQSPPPRLGSSTRVEYLDYQSLPDCREYRLAFDEGQRVSHVIFGVGVTMASSGGHTSVNFDGEGRVAQPGGTLRAAYVGDRPPRKEPAPRPVSPLSRGVRR